MAKSKVRKEKIKKKIIQEGNFNKKVIFESKKIKMLEVIIDFASPLLNECSDAVKFEGAIGISVIV